MTDNALRVSPDFDAAGEAINDSRQYYKRYKEVKDALCDEPKSALMAHLTRLLATKPRVTIVEMILGELNAKEVQELWRSYQEEAPAKEAGRVQNGQ